MKRRVLSYLLAACMVTLAVVPAAVWAEEADLYFPPVIDMELGSKEETRSEDATELDKINSDNAASMGSLSKTDWNAKANAAPRTGDWRDDLVALAESQVGYQEGSDGLTIYDQRPEKEKEPVEWTALFISWIADKAGLSKRDFPRGESYEALRQSMNKVHALKKISRANYPNYGDLAMIQTEDAQLVGVIIYVSNGYASVIHGDDNGKVTRSTWQVGTDEFQHYVDLNVLMERAGIDVDKGGEVPVIPEGGVAAWTNTNAVYLRKEPTIASKALTTVKKSGTAVLVTSAQKQEDGYIWYGVSYKSHAGYIRGDLLKLDMAAIPTATPAPTPVPTPTPAPVIPGCTVCVAAARGVALPTECCYEHLSAMDRGEMVRFMASLRAEDAATFRLYVDCHAAHVAGGAAALVCLGDGCGESAWTIPGAAHAAECPWHVGGGLSSQQRVVNVEVKEARTGQQVTILYEIYGATAFEWHEVTSVLNADGTVTENDTVLAGETAESITVTAKNAADTTYSYYCIATILTDGVPAQVRSKTTVLSVGDSPILAQAILGEEINFTYEHAAAASYQWYVQADENAQPAAISADDAAYSGANASKLTFHATAENSGALYSCAALSRDGSELTRSGFYACVITVYAEAPDASVCEGHDLCRYVEELAAMTREERFTALNETWYVSAADITGEASAEDCLAEYVMFHWFFCHAETYPNLLCTCTPTDEDRLVLHPYDETHEAECPWYAAPVTTSVGTEKVQKRADQEEFDKWAVTATAEMIARAKTVETLDHVVIEEKDDGTCDVYIARYADPVGTVDANGYLTYGNPARVIAWVDLTTSVVYPMSSLPAHAPAYAD